MNKIIVYVLNVNNDGMVKPRLVGLNKDRALDEIKKYIRCDIVECTDIVAGEKEYTVWSDENFLSRSDRVPTLYIKGDEGFSSLLCNNIMFTTVKDGKVDGITMEDVDIITDYINESRRLLKEDIKKGIARLY